MTFFGLTSFPFHSIIVEWLDGPGRVSIIFFLLGLVYSNLASNPKD